jgi:hypothetical protein
MVRDIAMESSDLFSHPYEPEAVSNREAFAEPVQAPVFSDSPRKESTPDTPPSS